MKLVRYMSDNLGLKLVSLGIAGLLWVIILGSQKVEVDKEVPIRVTTSDQVVPANDIPSKVTFRLSGPKGFLKQVVDRVEDPIEVDLTKSRPGLVTYRFFSDDVDVPLGVNVVSINPTAVFVRLEKIQTKLVPVHVDLLGKLPEGYQLKNVDVVPPKVLVRGASSRIKKVREISTAPINLDNLEESIEKLADLDLGPHNVVLAGDPPRVVVDIEAVAANFRIKNVKVRVLSKYQSRVSEETVTLYVRTTPSELKTLRQNKIFATVNLNGKAKGRYTRKIRVTLPKTVSLVRVVPEAVKVTLF